jgi:hypothetical protein
MGCLLFFFYWHLHQVGLEHCIYCIPSSFSSTHGCLLTWVFGVRFDRFLLEKLNQYPFFSHCSPIVSNKYFGAHRKKRTCIIDWPPPSAAAVQPASYWQSYSSAATSASKDPGLPPV